MELALVSETPIDCCAASGINQGLEFGVFTELHGKAEYGPALRLRRQSQQATAGKSGVDLVALNCVGSEGV